jgi:hypothetical protein
MSTTSPLTNSDIDTLMLALDAYKTKFTSDALLGSVMMAVLSGPSEDKDSFKTTTERMMGEAKKQEDGVEETIILLKAKLIQMRDKATIADVNDFLKGQ